MENEFQRNESKYVFNSKNDVNTTNVEHEIKVQNNKIISLNKKDKFSRDKLENITIAIDVEIQKGTCESTNIVEARIINIVDKDMIEDESEYTYDFLIKHRVGNDNRTKGCKIRTSKL